MSFFSGIRSRILDLVFFEMDLRKIEGDWKPAMIPK